MGARYRDPNDGIVPDNQSPERSVTKSRDTTRQVFKSVKTKVEIEWQAVQQAAKEGYDEFELMGELLRRQHSFDLNNLIRRGSQTHGLTGVANHPGIVRRVASFDWTSDQPADISEEYFSGIGQMIGSATEEDVPAVALLPTRQAHYFSTVQYSVADNTKLKGFIEGAYEGTPIPHKIMVDPGMAAAGPGGGPAALFYTNDPSLLRCTMPYYKRMFQPFDQSQWVISIEIVSRFCGVQVFDVDSVLAWDGGPAGWEVPPGNDY
jgi:hypothetical protein